MQDSDVRAITRHPSGVGSIIEFENFFGDTCQLFVVDAKYRARRVGHDHYHVVNDYHEWDIEPFFIGEGADDPKNPLKYSLSDFQLKKKFHKFRRCNSAEDTAKIIGGVPPLYSYDAGSTIWNLRSIKKDVGELHLPSIYELAIIYLEADRIDSMDPTAAEYPDLMLGCHAPDGRFATGAWTCHAAKPYSWKFYDEYLGWCWEDAYQMLQIGTNGKVDRNDIKMYSLVIPVKVIEPEE